MDTNSSGAVIRQNLLDRLLHAVKQVQVHFGARQEIATETDIRVSTLCTEWEAVLLHGQKKPKPKRIAPATKGGGVGTLWPMAKLVLSQEELHRFLQLEHTKSEIGRGRAWLRAAINERTLENYMHTILGAEQVLRDVYLESAFVLDLERASMLPVMAAGLSSIIFSIPVDADYLNTSSRVDVPLEATPPPLVSHAPSIMDRMPENNDDEEDDDIVAINAKQKKKKKKRSRTPQNDVTVDVIEAAVTPTNEIIPTTDMYALSVPCVGVVKNETDTPSIGESASSSSSRLSINDEGNPPMFVSFGTGHHHFVTSETEAAVNATALVLSATSGQPVEDVRSVESGKSGGAYQMSAGELKEAVLVLAKGKKELEDTNSHLRGMVAELETKRCQLLSDLETSNSEVASLRESHTSQLAGLERENDLLREQLKKYVGMVRNSSQSNESLVPSLSGENEGLEQKLAEMAEMYGELMELNGRLHQTVAGQETLITTLVVSITQAGMQLPVPADSLPASARQPRALVDVCIPSVIKKGRGPDGHHVYQVFVRVRKEEWNVYHRYAEFREFHLQLAKHLPQVNSFDFPPRKTRNKVPQHAEESPQVVEERRLKLQDYLRQVVELCSSTGISKTKGKGSPQAAGNTTHPVLQADINKTTLINLFPFFREDLYVDNSSTQQRPFNLSYNGL